MDVRTIMSLKVVSISTDDTLRTVQEIMDALERSGRSEDTIHHRADEGY